MKCPDCRCECATPRDPAGRGITAGRSGSAVAPAGRAVSAGRRTARSDRGPVCDVGPARASWIGHDPRWMEEYGVCGNLWWWCAWRRRRCCSPGGIAATTAGAGTRAGRTGAARRRRCRTCRSCPAVRRPATTGRSVDGCPAWWRQAQDQADQNAQKADQDAAAGGQPATRTPGRQRPGAPAAAPAQRAAGPAAARPAAAGPAAPPSDRPAQQRPAQQRPAQERPATAKPSIMAAAQQDVIAATRSSGSVGRTRAAAGARPGQPEPPARRLRRPDAGPAADRGGQRHAADMARRGYFAHESPNGDGAGERVQRRRLPVVAVRREHRPRRGQRVRGGGRLDAQPGAPGEHHGLPAATRWASGWPFAGDDTPYWVQDFATPKY